MNPCTPMMSSDFATLLLHALRPLTTASNTKTLSLSGCRRRAQALLGQHVNIPLSIAPLVRTCQQDILQSINNSSKGLSYHHECYGAWVWRQYQIVQTRTGSLCKTGGFPQGHQIVIKWPWLPVFSCTCQVRPTRQQAGVAVPTP